MATVKTKRRFPIKEGDTEPPLQLQILNPDDSPRDLSSDTVEFSMGKPGAALKINAVAMVAVNAPLGIFQYEWGVNDTNEIGDFRAEVWINSVETYPKEGYLIVSVGDRL